MSKARTQAPWEFLLSASRNTLQSYELSRLAHAANLRKEIATLLDQWLEENTAANLARWLIEQRELAVNTPAEESAPHEAAPSNAHRASDNFLVDRVVPPNGVRGRS
ncbi:MAG TPA: hypothetical protein VMH31_10060 [Methylomirabilota bacterium]|nr:hypothetical protein [Methylomirabilota bacterium]